MTVKEINLTYDKLVKEIYNATKDYINPEDTTIIYELNQESIDENDYQYFFNVSDRHCIIREMSIERVQKNGNIYGYVSDLGEYWTIQYDELLHIDDKLTLLNILSNESSNNDI